MLSTGITNRVMKILPGLFIYKGIIYDFDQFSSFYIASPSTPAKTSEENHFARVKDSIICNNFIFIKNTILTYFEFYTKNSPAKGIPYFSRWRGIRGRPRLDVDGGRREYKWGAEIKWKPRINV
jgi:hypothetical protein